MLWFKKWYHERFMNRSKDSIRSVVATADPKIKCKRKVIRIIYDGCNDDSITCRHRNSFWFIRRRRQQHHQQTIQSPIVDSVVSRISNISKNSVDSNVVVQLNRTEKHDVHKLQVSDNTTIINDTRQQFTDIDSSNRYWCSNSEIVHEDPISFVTNVNEYGNGENDCGSLSKSKDPRLRTFKLSIVPEICCNICNPTATSFDVKHCLNSDSNRIQIQYDSDGIVDIDEWPPKPFQQIDFLQQRIKELEYFISEIETRVRSGTTEKQTPTVIGTNQSPPKCRLCDDQPLTDWVIVSVDSKQNKTCESLSNEDRPSSSSSSSSSSNSITTQASSTSSSIVQYYTTSEFCDRKTIVTVHQCPSNYSLNHRGLYERTTQFSNQLHYGIDVSNSCAIERFLCFVNLLDLNIQTGTPSLNATIAVEAIDTLTSCTSDSTSMQFNSISTSNRRDFHSSDSIFLNKDPMYPEFNYLLQDPCTSSKHSNMLTAQMFHNSLSSISTIDSMKSQFVASKCYSNESIPEYFGLNECGDIIIHIDHICEEKGFGFLLGRKKKIYCDIPYGEEVVEKPKFSLKFAVKRLFTAMSNTFCKCTTVVGHPRNKITTNGPGDSIAAYALTLAKDPTSTFARNIENFIECTKESRESSPQIIMRNMRQFMSGMKNYLVKHGEGDFQQEVLRARSMLKPDEFLNLDTILEGVMHQLVVLPLREHLYGLFVDYYTGTGDIQLLVDNVKASVGKSPTDFGLRPCIQTPSPTAMQRISLLILRLQEAELPLAKLDILLSIVTSIIEATTNTQSHALGADDFLPLLVYIVAKCGFIGAEIEAEFMWCLLQPSLLNGEAGYYLTALCSAVHVLKSFITNEQDGTGSLDFRSSSLPACSSVLRVIIPDEYNGSLQTRTLPIRPHTTTREVCRTIAHKARVTNPQDYALFKLVDGEETLLLDSDCPQEARLAARGKPCMLAYKRIDAKIAWPTTSQAFQ
ncbi:uncharacterized protein LOC116348009 isoform X4 [Contarinia nasturtii]|uniref:uncharacterized protein LOC116348009 isoform X4 n=1 Tax=Contarinia nasturtii TaxID=265458 RepID=UPI0012D3DB2F|nr:uncharacterized protein LOC116348009 isoform X4 [Contarinia nasturtii]